VALFKDFIQIPPELQQKSGAFLKIFSQIPPNYAEKVALFVIFLLNSAKNPGHQPGSSALRFVTK
jgi:hypothetical protein